MLIFAKGEMINLQHIVEIYCTGGKICGKNETGKGYSISEYDTNKEAEIALEMIGRELQRNEIVFAPTKERVKAELVNSDKNKPITHLSGGRKQKGHGGS
ncbi:MAG: hypothetical protein RR275_09285 [Lachnospiraceae bacterium]